MPNGGFMSDAQCLLTPEELAELGVAQPEFNLSVLRALVTRWREMNARRCGTCRWWALDEAWGPEARVCLVLNGSRPQPAVVMTRENFGCVHWERAR